MITAIDSCVLFDILLDDSEHGDASELLVGEALTAGRAIVCPIVYAELAAHFDDRSALDAMLAGLQIEVADLDPETLFRAGQAWRRYTDHRPAGMVCGRCGGPVDTTCPACGQVARPRQHVLADFIIGAHALRGADRLLTRDTGYYRRFFPDLVLDA